MFELARPVAAALSASACPARPELIGAVDDGAPKIEPGDTELENRVLATLRRVFPASCSRARVVLAPPLAAAVSNTSWAGWSDVKFRMKGSAQYEEKWAEANLTRSELSEQRTARYCLYAPQLVESDEVSRGPGLLFAWGQGGTETAFWMFVLARLLKKRFATFTSSRRAHFLVADWPRLTVHPRPTSLRCFEPAAAGVRVLVEARATSPQQSGRLWRRRKSQSERKTVSPTSRVAAAQVPGFTAQHGGLLR